MSTLGRHLKALDRVAELVRDDAPGLLRLRQRADGRFLKRTVAIDIVNREVRDRLAQGFRGLTPDEFPFLYFAWGKARVGSTALTNLFGVAGLPAYYQPVKAIGRQALAAELPSAWTIPSAPTHPCIFAKETGGPYHLFDCLFIPLQLLIEAGYPPDKLHLILLERAPIDSLASWITKLSHLVPADILVRHYVIAALNLRRVKNYAKRSGVPVTHYAYEASKEPVPSARALFDRLGLRGRFTDNVVTDWKEMGQLESEDARVIYPEQPSIYHVPGLHGSDVAYCYHGRRTASITDEQLSVLDRSGVQDVYREAVKGCAADLGLDADTSTRLFGLDPFKMAA